MSRVARLAILLAKLKSQTNHLRPMAAKVRCGQRPPHIWCHREAIYGTVRCGRRPQHLKIHRSQGHYHQIHHSWSSYLVLITRKAWNNGDKFFLLKHTCQNNDFILDNDGNEGKLTVKISLVVFKIFIAEGLIKDSKIPRDLVGMS